MALTLHGYWRATSPYRVRIALNLKGLDYEKVGVNLVEGGQFSDAYVALNPQKLIPTLVADGVVLQQSLAIIEWLEETHPEPPLLPKAANDRAVVRAMANIIACDIHPLNNQRILKALSGLGHDEAARNAWIHRWIGEGFTALETMILAHGQGFAFGPTPTLADCCLIPQVYSANRFKMDLAAYPAIRAVAARCAEIEAFIEAQPDRQPDAPKA
jgi:maleylacetoacetate isomerase